jgi:hypothetical protein
MGACFALALLTCSLGPVFAQELVASETKEDTAYRASVNDALAEYAAGHFEEARVLFRRAHELDPNARTLRGIGMASFDLRDYVAAVHALSASLVEARKPLSPEQRTHVQGLLERSRLFVGVYTLKVAPPDAWVLIDGRPRESEPDGTVLLGFGTHNLEVGKPGYVSRTFSVSVRGGEGKELPVTLERKPQVVARPAGEHVPAEVVRESPPPATTRGSRFGTGWLFAASVAGLAGGGAGAYLIFENDQLRSCRNPAEGLRCKNQPAVETKRNVGVAATLVAGAAAVTMAVVGLLSGPSARPASAHSALSCAVLPSGVVCAKAF